MKLIKAAFAVVALTGGLTVVGADSASAAVIYAGQNTYLGAFTVPPADPNSETFSRGQNDLVPFPTGAFDDFYVFNLAPAAQGQLSANFVPVGAITGFTGGIYAASGFAGCAIGAPCAGGVIGAVIAESGIPGIAFPGVVANLTAGQYAVRVRGTSVSDQTSYSGQVAFIATPQVPEPTSLVLLGLGLLGAGIARRRRS